MEIDPNVVSLGALGESLAARKLTELGYYLLERNYRKPWGEIDLIMQKGNSVHFFEVKTVSKENLVRPEENLHAEKLKRVTRAAQSYVNERGVEQWQIDAVLISVDLEARVAELELLEHVGF